MNNPALITAFALTLFMGFATAQELTPSMSPGTGSGESSPDKSSPFGFKGMGGDRPKDSKTEITATKQATFDNAASVAEFEGKVVVRDPQFTLFCDHLKVSLAEDRKGIKTAEALGNVTIVQENTDAEGQKSSPSAEPVKPFLNPPPDGSHSPFGHKSNMASIIRLAPRRERSWFSTAMANPPRPEEARP